MTLHEVEPFQRVYGPLLPGQKFVTYSNGQNGFQASLAASEILQQKPGLLAKVSRMTHSAWSTSYSEEVLKSVQVFAEEAELIFEQKFKSRRGRVTRMQFPVQFPEV